MTELRQDVVSAPVVVVVHADSSDVSWVAEILEGLVDTRFVRPYRGDALPDIGDVAAVVSLGGPQNVYERDEDVYLRDEEAFLAGAVEAHRPVLGICLGSQLLAQAMGGRAVRGAKGPEFGPIEVTVDPDTTDPILAGRSGTYMSLHNDSFELPTGATLLAWSDRYPQAYRVGSALGVQFHPEISLEGVARAVAAIPDVIRSSGSDPDYVLDWARRNAAASRERAEALFRAWLAHGVEQSWGRETSIGTS